MYDSNIHDVSSCGFMQYIIRMRILFTLPLMVIGYYYLSLTKLDIELSRVFFRIFSDITRYNGYILKTKYVELSKVPIFSFLGSSQFQTRNWAPIKIIIIIILN